MRAVIFFLGVAAISQFSGAQLEPVDVETTLWITGGLLILDVIEVFR